MHWHSRASRNYPAFDRFDIFLVSLWFEMAFERSSSADTADFTEGIQKYDCLCNEFSKDFYKNSYTKMNCWRSVADKFDICRDSLRSGCSPTRLHFFLSLVFPSLVRPIWRQVRSLLDLYLLFPKKNSRYAG